MGKNYERDDSSGKTKVTGLVSNLFAAFGDKLIQKLRSRTVWLPFAAEAVAFRKPGAIEKIARTRIISSLLART